MPTSVLIAVFGTLAGAAITGLLSLYSTKLQQEQMNNRVEAEQYVEVKLEKFMELDEKLVEIDDLLVSFVFEARKEDYELEMSEENYSQLSKVMDESQTLSSKCGLFLEWEKRENLAHSFIPFTVVFNSIQSGDDRKIDWKQVESNLSKSDGSIRWELKAFRKHIRDARIIIKDEINEPIRQLRQ